MERITRDWILPVVLVLVACASAGQAAEQAAKVHEKPKQGTTQKLTRTPKISHTPDLKRADTDREIKMIMLNQELNKKEQPVTQLTNVKSNKHDTVSAIIKNIK